MAALELLKIILNWLTLYLYHTQGWGVEGRVVRWALPTLLTHYLRKIPPLLVEEGRGEVKSVRHDYLRSSFCL
jgi:hypothetical protein